MRFRKLRVAWSVGCGIACLLLVVLWAKSIWCPYCIDRTKGGVHTSIAAARGVIAVSRYDWNNEIFVIEDKNWGHRARYPQFDWRHLAFKRNGRYLQFQTPFRLPLALTIAFATLPWMRWSKRFSIRSLLIATSLVAVVLGLAVWMVRS